MEPYSLGAILQGSEEVNLSKPRPLGKKSADRVSFLNRNSRLPPGPTTRCNRSSEKTLGVC